MFMGRFSIQLIHFNIGILELYIRSFLINFIVIKTETNFYREIELHKTTNMVDWEKCVDQ